MIILITGFRSSLTSYYQSNGAIIGFRIAHDIVSQFPRHNHAAFVLANVLIHRLFLTGVSSHWSKFLHIERSCLPGTFKCRPLRKNCRFRSAFISLGLINMNESYARRLKRSTKKKNPLTYSSFAHGGSWIYLYLFIIWQVVSNYTRFWILDF